MISYLSALLETKIKSEKAQSMVEYGLIIAVIAVVVLVALTPVGTAVHNVFDGIVTSITGGAGS